MNRAELLSAYANGVRYFEYVDFSNEDFRGISIPGTTLWDCNFENSNLDHANLFNCEFNFCNFKNTSFNEANLKNGLINECIFEKTSFICANLKGTILEEVDESQANFEGASFLFYVSVKNDIPVDGKIMTAAEFSQLLLDVFHIKNIRKFESREKAQSFIDSYNNTPTSLQS